MVAEMRLLATGVWFIHDVLALAKLRRVLIIALKLLGCILDEPAQMQIQIAGLSN